MTGSSGSRCAVGGKFLAAGLLATVGLLGGCHPNDQKEIALYRAVLDGKTPLHVEYRAGDQLTLPTALLLANQHNERLAISGEDYLQALIDKDRAASNFFPTVSFAPSYSKADSSGDAGNRRITSGGGTADPTSLLDNNSAIGDAFDAPVNLNANVFRGFRDVANIRRAASDINRYRALLLDLQASVLLDVAKSYYSVLGAEQAVRVLEKSVQTQDARVGEMQMKEKIGSGQRLDVAQIEAQAAATRADLVLSRRDVRNARTMLAFLTAAPVQDAELLDRLDVPGAVSPPEVFLALAEVERQDLAASRAAIETARQNVASAFGEFYPSISVNVNYYLKRQSVPADSEWNSLISLNVPIFTAGRIWADVRTAVSRFRQAKQDESLTRRQVENDVLSAHENLTASTHRLEELKIEAQAAETALQVSEGRYRAGLGTYLERLVAQDRELSAELDFTKEEYNRKIFYLNLLRTAGQLGRPEEPVMLGLPLLSTQPASKPATFSGPTTMPGVGMMSGGPTSSPADADPAGNATTRPAARPELAPSVSVPGANPASQPASQPTTLPTTRPAN